MHVLAQVPAAQSILLCMHVVISATLSMPTHNA